MQVKHGLDQQYVDNIAVDLFGLLSNSHVISVMTLNCHWNLEDSGFYFLHGMFEEQYKQLAESGDMLAERIRSLGHSVSGSLSNFLDKASVSEIEGKLSAKEMLELLSRAYEGVLPQFRVAISTADNNNDPGTSDLLTEILRDLEKTVWILRSHL